MGKTCLVVLQFLKALLFYFFSWDWLHATIELNTDDKSQVIEILDQI